MGAALSDCAISILHVADDTQDLSEKAMSEWIMLGVSGSAKGARCIQGVRKAQQADLAAGRRTTLTTLHLPQIRTNQVVALETADTFLTQAARLGKVFALRFVRRQSGLVMI